MTQTYYLVTMTLSQLGCHTPNARHAARHGAAIARLANARCAVASHPAAAHRAIATAIAARPAIAALRVRARRAVDHHASDAPRPDGTSLTLAVQRDTGQDGVCSRLQQ